MGIYIDRDTGKFKDIVLKKVTTQLRNSRTVFFSSMFVPSDPRQFRNLHV